MSRTDLYLSHNDAGLTLSRQEFAQADFERPWRYERADGRLVVMVPPGFDHHATVEPFRDAVVGYKIAHPEIIEHVFQESWAAIDEHTDRFPDLAVYLTSYAGQDRFPERVPELIFEIVSAGSENRRRDYVGKRSEYERIGVQEYVIVDRFEHRVTVLRLVEGRYAEAHLGPADIYTTPLLPGLEIQLAGVIGE